jgi:hypothetical protein
MRRAANAVQAIDAILSKRFVGQKTRAALVQARKSLTELEAELMYLKECVLRARVQ